MLWHCLACTTRYAFDLLTCPHCRSGERRPADQADEQEDGMPKTARWAAPSQGGDPAAEAVPDEAVPAAESEREAAGPAAEPDVDPEPKAKAAPSLSKAKDG